MENALGLGGYQSTMLIIVFVVLGFGIAALFAALFLPARWRLPYSMEFLFIGLLAIMVWYGDKRSTEIWRPIKRLWKKKAFWNLATTRKATISIASFGFWPSNGALPLSRKKTRFRATPQLSNQVNVSCSACLPTM